MVMLKRKNAFIAGCAFLVIVPVILIWAFAWPMLRPVPFPVLVEGQMVQPVDRPLKSEEVKVINQWVQAHRTSWGTKGEKSPGAPSVQFSMEGASGEKLYVSFWHFRHGDDVAGFQTELNGPFRMSSVGKEQLDIVIKSFPDISWKAKK